MQLSLASSSLSALDQIRLSKIKSRKRMWITSIIMATLLAIYQTTDIICSFLDTPIKQFEIEVITNATLMVTVCFSNPQSYNLTDLNEEQVHILEKMANLSDKCKLHEPSLFCLSLLSENERFKIGFTVHRNQFALILGYGIQQVFNNLFYGNCATIGYNKLDSNLETVNCNDISFIINNLNHIPMIMIIHQEGALPVFKTENIIVLEGPDIVAMVKVKKTLYKQDSYGIDCIADKSLPMRIQIGREDELQNFNFNNGIYSIESCLDQCLHALTKQFCKCILPKSMRGQNSDMLPICTQYCAKVPDDVMKAMCNCKPSCESTEVTAVADYSYEFNGESLPMFFKMWTWSAAIDVNLAIKSYLDELSKLITFYDITVSTPLFAKLTIKESSIKLEDALSTIGGIWGFWIGLSISVLLAMAIEMVPKSAKFLKKSFFNFQCCLNVMHKTIWFIGIILIAISLTWQLYLIITEYLRYTVLEVITTTAQDSNSFPSVFVCQAGLIWNNDMEQPWALYKDDFKRLNETEQNLFYPKVKDFVASCEFETNTKVTVPCEIQSLRITFSYYPIQCAIINTNNVLKFKEISTIQNMKLKLKFLRWCASTGIKVSVGFNSFSMIPVLETQMPLEVIDVYPGDLVDVKYSLIETNRLPSPYASQCVDESTKYTTWPSRLINISHQLNYSYNFKDCLHLCIFKLHEGTVCNFVDIQKFIDNPDNQSNAAEHIDNCGCKHSCRDKEYSFQIVQTKFVFKKQIQSVHFNNKSEAMDYVWQGNAVVNIRAASNSKTVISEKPTIEPDSLVGLIGGISGLWIGQSILTLIVELHTIGNIIVTKIWSKSKMF